MAGMAVGDFLTAAAQVATGSLLGKQQAQMDLARQQQEQAETARQQAQLALEQRRMGWEERRDAGLDADRADARAFGGWQRQHLWDKEGMDTLQQEIARTEGGIPGASDEQRAAMVARAQGLHGQLDAARGRMTPPPGATGAMPDLGFAGAAPAGAAPTAAPAAPWNPATVGPPPPGGGGAAPAAAAPGAPLRWQGIDLEHIYQPASRYMYPYGMVHDAPAAAEVKNLEARIAARELALQKTVHLPKAKVAELGRLAGLLGPLTNPEAMNKAENWLRKTEHYTVGHSAQETTATDREAKEKAAERARGRSQTLREEVAHQGSWAQQHQVTSTTANRISREGQGAANRTSREGIAGANRAAQAESQRLNRQQRETLTRARLAGKGKGSPMDLLSGTEKMMIRNLQTRNRQGVSDGMGNFIHAETPEQRAANTAREWRVFAAHGLDPKSIGAEDGGPGVTEKMVRDAYHAMGPLPAVGLGRREPAGGAVKGGPTAGGTGTPGPRLPPVDPAAIEATKRAGYMGPPVAGAGKPPAAAPRAVGKTPPVPGRNPYPAGGNRAAIWDLHRQGMTSAEILKRVGPDPAAQRAALAIIGGASAPAGRRAAPAAKTVPVAQAAPLAKMGSPANPRHASTSAGAVRSVAALPALGTAGNPRHGGGTAVPTPITAKSQAAAALPKGFRGWSAAGLTMVRQGYVPEPLRGMSKEVQQAAIDALGTAEQRFGQQVTLPKQGGVRTAADQQRLYAGRGSNPNPVAPPGASTHQYGMAMDVTLGKGTPAEQAQLAQLMEPRGWHWAGTADPVHFTYTGGQGSGVRGQGSGVRGQGPAAPVAPGAKAPPRPAPRRGWLDWLGSSTTARAAGRQR